MGGICTTEKAAVPVFTGREMIRSKSAETYKDHQTGIVTLTWRIRDATTFNVGIPEFHFDNFSIELTHRNLTVTSIVLYFSDFSTEDTANFPFEEIDPKVSEKYNLKQKKTEHDAFVTNIILEMREDSLQTINAFQYQWTSNQFDRPEQAELEALWNFTTNDGKRIIRDLCRYRITELKLIVGNEKIFHKR